MSETNAADDYNLEHQFGTAAYRRRCEVREVGSARRALPAGNQVSRRQDSAQAFQAFGLRARGAKWTEGLSRRRRALAPAVRNLQHPVVLRQGRLPARLGRAWRARGATRSDHVA